MRAKSREHDFDHPSFWFILEDRIKNRLGSFYYRRDIRSLNLKGSESVLDFGCGGGTASRYLMKSLSAQGHLLGVDTSAYWINIASQRLKKYVNATFRLGDIRTMGLPDGTLDVVIAIHVLHHIEPAERASVLGTLARLMKEGGRLLVRERTEVGHGIPPAEIGRLLLAAGFKEVAHSVTKSEYRGLYSA